ncbi:MAG TPA: T9SS type A sorting domain-containing protein [Paludibacter sp.]|nr:T9SS type A sorting domain-containing protein [Paludibacter sp.]
MKHKSLLTKTILLVSLLMQGNLTLKAQTIGIYDLRYTLSTSLSTEAGKNTAWDDVHTVATLQGIVNRDAPNLFVNFIVSGTKNVDSYWWDKYRQAGQWLNGRDTVVYSTLEALITAYRPYVKGAVVYDPNVASTSNVASAVAGIDSLIAIRYDLTSTSLYSRLVLNGPQLPVRKWLVNTDGSSMFTGSGTIPGTTRASSGSKKNDAYIWFIEKYMKTGLCNTEFAAYYIDQYWKTNPTASVRNHHTLSNHDFFVSKKGFFFDLSPWGDEAATDEASQTVGTDLATLKEMLLLAYQQNNPGGKMCYIGGFPAWAWKYTTRNGGSHTDVNTEWEFAKIISAYNAFEDADAIGYGALANASFWQHFPLQGSYPQSWASHDDLLQRGLLTKEGKVNLAGKKDIMIFYVGDYDAASWVSQKTYSIWDDTNRGSVPLMWCISPVLQERIPHVLHYYRQTATPNDYFAASDNGAGYLMPGMLQTPRDISGLPSGLDAWKNHCKTYYDKWGLSITGFVIDGNAPAMDTTGLNCYSYFSPNGIVPQKTISSLPASIRNNMPILKSDVDLNDNDPATAAQNIISRIHSRGGISFHWFRNILKTPTWYKNVVSQINLLDTSIVLLDAPSYFELLRVYMTGNGANVFSGGTGTSSDPFIIKTVEQFSAIRNFRDKCYLLANDLDFRDYCAKYIWNPIGEVGSGDGDVRRFRGVFDGGGHTIKNLTAINQTTSYDMSVFGYCEGATIKNLLIDSCRIAGAGRLGILTGEIKATAISQVGVKNSSCTSTGSDAGGITGTVRPLGTTPCSISNCYATGVNLTVAANCAGGISSRVESGGGTIVNCWASAKITGTGSTSANLGGIAGYLTGSTTYVQNCVVVGGSLSLTTSASTNIYRIVGALNSSAYLTGNAASDTMKVNGAVPTTNIGATLKNGQNATTINLATVSYYSGLNFAINETTGQIWRINTFYAPYPTFVWQSPFAGGGGTQSNPFQITTINQFDQIRNYRTSNFILMNDLDFTGYVFPSRYSSTTWWPIGEYGSGDGDALRFKGMFDGGGHTIKKLIVTNRTTSYDMSIFGYCEGATIKNLLIDSCQIAGAGRLGILTGEIKATTISQVGVKNSSCTSTGGDAGGITGSVRPLGTSPCSISNCYATGVNLTVAANYAGGISARVESNGGTISNCIASAKITGTGSTSANLGGIAGAITGSTVQNCVTVGGRISLSSSTSSNVGRIVGVKNSGGTLSGNAACDTIKVKGAVPAANVGANKINGANATVTNLATASYYAGLGFAINDGSQQVWKIHTAYAPIPVLLWDLYRDVTINYKDAEGNMLKTSRVQSLLVAGSTYTATSTDKQDFCDVVYDYRYDPVATVSDNVVVSLSGTSTINLIFSKILNGPAKSNAIKNPTEDMNRSKTSGTDSGIKNIDQFIFSNGNHQIGVYCKSATLNDVKVVVYSIVGSKVAEKSLNSTYSYIDTPDSGIYIVVIKNKGIIETKKIIIN